MASNMQTNLEKYRKDLDQLISDGDILEAAMRLECFPKDFKLQINKVLKDKAAVYIEKIPSFRRKYQTWYSESLVLIRLLLSDRLNDFIKAYEKPKGRKVINHENYAIEDYLRGLTVTHPYTGEKLAEFQDAISQFEMQLNILKSVKKRFESSLFDIRQLLQADLFDSGLDAARELNKKGFVRGAGAMAGVVLESHLAQVCENHTIKFTKTRPTINDYNQLLKDKDIIETPIWRSIQHLGDLRNLCDHKGKEPTKEQIEELIAGVEKVTKTIF